MGRESISLGFVSLGQKRWGFVHIYSLDELTDVTQGNYEYEYKEDSAQQSITTSSYQDSGSPEKPRYAPSPDPAYIDSGQVPYSSSPVTSGYTTSNFEDTTAALGNLNLEKGKERVNGNFKFFAKVIYIKSWSSEEYVAPQVSTSYSVAASVAPSMDTAPSVIDRTYAAPYSPTTETSYQQLEYYKAQYDLNNASSSSQQGFDSGRNWQGWYPNFLEQLPPKGKVTILK
jgi:hypothetical protein